MNKKLIKLTEIDLHRIVKESAQKILNEIGDTPRGQFALGAVAARAGHRMFNSKSDRERDYWNNVKMNQLFKMVKLGELRNIKVTGRQNVWT